MLTAIAFLVFAAFMFWAMFAPDCDAAPGPELMFSVEDLSCDDDDSDDSDDNDSPRTADHFGVSAGRKAPVVLCDDDDDDDDDDDSGGAAALARSERRLGQLRPKYRSNHIDHTRSKAHRARALRRR